MTKQVAWVFGLFAVVSAACGDNSAPGVVDPGSSGSSGSSTGTGGAGAAPVAPIPETSAPVVPGASCAGVTGDQTMSRPLTPPLQLGTASLAVAPPAISGGTLRVLSDGHSVVAADPDRDQIYVADLDAHAVTSTIALDPGDEPGRVAEDAAGVVHVALRGGGAVVSINPALGVITNRRAVCAAPRGIAYDAAVDLLHVACAGGELVSLPASGGAAVRTLSLAPDLRDVVVDGPQLRVSRFRSAELLTVDADGRVSSTQAMPSARSAAVRGGQMFTPSVAWRMVGMPAGGGVAMVHQRGVADEVQTNTASGYGGKNTCDSIIHTAVTVVSGDGTIASGPALADLPVAVDLAVSPDGKAIAVISAGNARMSGGVRTGMVVADTGTVTDGKIGCRGGTGSTSCSGQSCSGHIPTISGQPVAVAYAPDGDVIVQSREPAQLLIPGASPLVLSTVSRADPGHDVFHVNAGAALACASCHAEGRDDGRTWNFACGNLRRTQSLQIGLRGTEPFHWSGDEKDFTALVHDVFNNRMSGPTLPDPAIGMTLSWIDAQPRMRLAPPADAAAVERGRTHFVNAACATCHTGEHFTNNQTMDVGTGGTFQVPSLVGIAARAPFLHNGCAATLRDRFRAECGGGDKHGLTSRLTANELSDLVTYLETL